MDRNAQIERAWQLVLGARNELVHAQTVVASKSEQLDRANHVLRTLLDAQQPMPTDEHTITDEHIVARILEVK